MDYKEFILEDKDLADLIHWTIQYNFLLGDVKFGTKRVSYYDYGPNHDYEVSYAYVGEKYKD